MYKIAIATSILIICFLLSIIYEMNQNMIETGIESKTYIERLKSLKQAQIEYLNNKIKSLNDRIDVNVKLNKILIKYQTKLFNQLIHAESKHNKEDEINDIEIIENNETDQFNIDWFSDR